MEGSDVDGHCNNYHHHVRSDLHWHTFPKNIQKEGVHTASEMEEEEKRHGFAQDAMFTFATQVMKLPTALQATMFFCGLYDAQ